jgi:glucose/arabinose dehydrogenase
MHVAKIVPWGSATPTVPAGLQVKALATGLKNPRSLYVLPNGDILVVEANGPKGPINRPKELVMNWIERQAHSKTKAGNRIVLLRPDDAGNVALRTRERGARGVRGVGEFMVLFPAAQPRPRRWEPYSPGPSTP